MEHTSKVVGTSAVQLISPAATTLYYQGVQIKAASGNSGKIYIGSSSAVTADTAAATDGFELSAGESLFIPKGDPSKLFAIASVASQKVFILGL